MIAWLGPSLEWALVRAVVSVYLTLRQWAFEISQRGFRGPTPSLESPLLQVVREETIDRDVLVSSHRFRRSVWCHAEFCMLQQTCLHRPWKLKVFNYDTFCRSQVDSLWLSQRKT